jgi:hypothetical protein
MRLGIFLLMMIVVAGCANEDAGRWQCGPEQRIIDSAEVCLRLDHQCQLTAEDIYRAAWARDFIREHCQ